MKRGLYVLWRGIFFLLCVDLSAPSHKDATVKQREEICIKPQPTFFDYFPSSFQL